MSTSQTVLTNNNNVNNNAPGGSIVNNNYTNAITIQLQRLADDLDRIERALAQHHVPRALYDAQPLNAGCMEGTRVKLLDNAEQLVNIRGGAHIVWIVGMAGTGKTSIALTLCRRLATVPTPVLGGTFFCSRSAGVIERMDVQRIIPTLAIVLARRLPGYAQALALELKEDPDLGHKAISVQIERLLVRPLEIEAFSDQQIVFIIDALDECSDQDQLAELINALANLTSPAPIKFIFTSRPDLHIRETLIADMSRSSIVQLDMVDETLVTADIRLYIQRTFENSSQTLAWFTNGDLDDLAILSGGLFIYASTAVAYILKRRDTPGRSERLRMVKMKTSASALVTGPLDKIYSLVLMQASDPNAYEPKEVHETRRIVAVILSARAPLTIKALAELLGLSPEQLRGALDGLHAVIFVPEKDEEGELRTLHASFSDFIFTRSPEHIRIERNLGNNELAWACLRRMTADDLCFNVSRSRSSYTPNRETKPGWIARSLVYACLHWAHHMPLASVGSSFDEMVHSVLRLKLLFWLEVLSVMGEVGRASGLLRVAATAVNSSNVIHFLRDANSFVASSREAIDRSAPHIYLSAVAFAPKDSLVYQTFGSQLVGIPVIEPFGINRNDGRCVMVLAGHKWPVMAIAYSPDDKFIASGSGDTAVRVWDSRSGEETCAPLVGSDGWIQSIAYSPDGHRLVAGTSHGSIVVWEVGTGRLLVPAIRRHHNCVQAVTVSPDGAIIASASEDSTVALCLPSSDNPMGKTLHGHEGRVYAVTFSLDGAMLTSGGSDSTIRFWDSHLGLSLKEPLKVSIEQIQSMAFSQGGIYLAAGSHGNVVSVWDVRNGQQLHTYSGHQGPVMSLDFAPNGHTLASASGDFTVHIWSPNTTDRTKAALALRGHSECVNSVSFSRNGLYVASGSTDGTVRVWDVSRSSSAGVQQDGHTHSVHAIAISSDSRLVASASADRSARVWDMGNCEQVYSSFLGHEGAVRSIAFSSDGRWIATGSDDTTLRLWDARTGQIIIPELLGHYGPINAVVFSPDGSHLASGSDDNTIRIWSLTTGSPAQSLQVQWNDRILSVDYSPDGGHIGAGDDHSGIIIFDAATGDWIWHFRLQATGSPFQFFLNSRDVTSVVFSPDGGAIVAASDRAVAAFDVHTGDRVFNVSGLTDHVNAVAYSVDGQLIASGAEDWTIQLWRPSVHECLQMVLYGHAGAVSSVSFSSDSRFLVTGSSDNTVRIWDLERLRPQVEEYTPSPLDVLAFARYAGDGWLVSPSGELLLWVPIEYRGHLEIGDYSRVIATYRVVVTVEDGVLHQGEQWTSCWRTHDVPTH